MDRLCASLGWVTGPITMPGLTVTSCHLQQHVGCSSFYFSMAKCPRMFIGPRHHCWGCPNLCDWVRAADRLILDALGGAHQRWRVSCFLCAFANSEARCSCQLLHVAPVRCLDETQRYRDTEVQRCRGAEVQRRRGRAFANWVQLGAVIARLHVLVLTHLHHLVAFSCAAALVECWQPPI
jgi:hypothetical protein